MAVFYNIDDLPAFRNPVITIGTFDGVHQGHKAILREVAHIANEIDGESILITFDPHPRKLLFPDHPIKLLTPLDKKLQLITGTGITHIVVVPFTKEFSNLSASDYITQFLVARFHPHTIIIGYDHRFGHDRAGNIVLLKQHAAQYNYKVVEIPVQLIDEASISSTRIRNAVAAGKVADAAQMLGHHYSLSGTVVRGRQLGHTIGYPTANIRPDEPEQLVPGNGIYAVYVKWKGHQYGGMLSIGYNPTVTEEKIIHIEVNIFDFDQEIYGETLEIDFVDYLRAEVKFDSMDALKEQLHQDRVSAKRALK